MATEHPDHPDPIVKPLRVSELARARATLLQCAGYLEGQIAASRIKGETQETRLLDRVNGALAVLDI